MGGRQPGTGAAHHRRPITLAIGSGLFLGFGLALLVSLPGVLAELSAFDASGPCPGNNAAGAAGRPCWVTEPATIQRTFQTQAVRGAPRRWITVAVPGGGTGSIEVARRAPAYDRLVPGQPITLTIWGPAGHPGRVVTVTTATGELLESVDNPHFKGSDRPLLGFFLTCFGVFGLWVAWRARQRSGSWTAPEVGVAVGGSMQSTVIAATGFVSVCTGIIAYGYLGFSALATVALMVSIAAVLGLLMARRLRQLRPRRP